MARNQRDSIELFHDYGLHIPTRTIYVGSENSADSGIDGGESGVDHMLSARLIKNLHALETINSEPITIILNNVGGDEYHCIAIYDAIRAAKSHVTIKVMGSAMSCGSIILQAADRRVMSPNSVQMIHYGTWGVNDHAKTAQAVSKEGERIDAWMEQLYLNRIQEKLPNFKLKKLQDLLMIDTYLTAQQCVDLGLADEIE